MKWTTTRRTRWHATGIALALVLAAGAAAPAAAKGTFAYVHDREDGGSIYAFAVDKQGNLTTIAGSPFALVDTGSDCGGQCLTMAYSSKRKVLYTGGQTGVSGWSVGSDGMLTPVPGSPFHPGAGGSFIGTGVVQIGKRVFVYAASVGDDGVYAWEAAKDGTLTELAGSPFPAGVGPVGLATKKKFVFVGNQGDGSVASYVAQKDGTLVAAPGSPLVIAGASGYVYSPSPDSHGKVLYVSDAENGTRAFSIDKKTAQLVELAGSPFPAQAGGNGTLVLKKLLYAVTYDDPNDALQPFSIGKKGVLSPTGIIINAPFGIDAFGADKKGKWMIFAGPDAVILARQEKGTKDGSLEGPGPAGFLTTINPNAAILIKR